MPETYSLGSLAVHASSRFATKIVTLPDSVAQPGNQAAAMRTGSQVLCKNPDGSMEYYTIDHERTRPGGQVYLLHTKP